MTLRLPSRRRRLAQQFEYALPRSSISSPQARARQARVPADVRAQFEQHLEQQLPQRQRTRWWAEPLLTIADIALGLWDALSELL